MPTNLTFPRSFKGVRITRFVLPRVRRDWWPLAALFALYLLGSAIAPPLGL